MYNVKNIGINLKKKQHFFVCLQSPKYYIYGLVQDYSISIANTLVILQSCTKPLTYDCNVYITPLIRLWPHTFHIWEASRA